MTTLRQSVTDAVWPSLLATRLAQEANLPAGSMAVPGWATAIKRLLASGLTREQVRESMWMSVFGKFPDEIPDDSP